MCDEYNKINVLRLRCCRLPHVANGRFPAGDHAGTAEEMPKGQRVALGGNHAGQRTPYLLSALVRRARTPAEHTIIQIDILHLEVQAAFVQRPLNRS